MKYIFSAVCLLSMVTTSVLSQNSYDCPFSYRSYAHGDICGYIDVPIDYNYPSGEKIRISYLVIKSKSKNPKPDPIIFIQGGPGGNTLALSDIYGNLIIDHNRDFVIYDQRGVGYSSPLCPQLNTQLMGVLAEDLTAESEAGAMADQVAICIDSLKKESIDLRTFNTQTNAADLESLRKHLGYEQWNLFGGSYGTRLALTYLDLFADHARTAILVGVFPPQVRMYEQLVTSFDKSLSGVFKKCANDPKCNMKYPNLQDDFFNLLNRLKSDPITIDYNGSGYTINAQDLLLIIHQMSYTRNDIANIPSLIKSAIDRNPALLRRAVNQLGQRIQLINMVAYWSVMTGDEGRESNLQMLADDLEKHSNYFPGIGFFISDPSIINSWPSNHPGITHPKAVTSEVPVLLVSGELDPITPPTNAALAAQTLPNGYAITFSNEGHSPFTPCFYKIAAAFLDEPFGQPGDPCIRHERAIEWR